jgi:hypothetical protein
MTSFSEAKSGLAGAWAWRKGARRRRRRTAT